MTNNAVAASWGEKGYIRVQITEDGIGMCGMYQVWSTQLYRQNGSAMKYAVYFLTRAITLILLWQESYQAPTEFIQILAWIWAVVASVPDRGALPDRGPAGISREGIIDWTMPLLRWLFCITSALPNWWDEIWIRDLLVIISYKLRLYQKSVCQWIQTEFNYRYRDSVRRLLAISGSHLSPFSRSFCLSYRSSCQEQQHHMS